MRKITILLITCMILLMPFVAGAEPCSKPTINIQRTVLNAEDITSGQGEALNDAFSTYLRERNPNVEMISNQEIGYFLDYERKKILLGDDKNINSGDIASKINADYLMTLEIAKLGSVYTVTSTLIDVDNFVVVVKKSQEVGSIDSLPETMSEQANQMGDLASIIEDYEIRSPVPPRDPSMDIEVTPQTISVEDGKDTCTLKVTVLNCKGEVVKKTKVFFREYNDRGIIKGEKASNDIRYNGYQYATTDEDGIATVTYKLDVSKGKSAGKDVIPIFTIGRGQEKIRSTAAIQIKGVYLEAYTEKSEIGPRQQTDITISLFEMDEQANKVPLEGKSLYIEDFRLSDGSKIVPLGPVDGDGNPITDDTGKAYVRFIAGEKEKVERIRIIFQDVGAGYLDAIETWVDINIKKDEYLTTITWKENGEWYHYIPGTEELDMEYKFLYSSQTNLDKYSGKERTDASFSYTDREVLTYGTDISVSKWVIASNIEGDISDYPTVNGIASERFDAFYVPLTDLPLEIPVNGRVSLTITNGDEYGYDIDDTVFPLQSAPLTSLPLESVPPNPRPTTNDQSDWNYWLGIQELTRLKYDVDRRFSTFSESDISENFQLNERGRGIYTSQWHYEDSFYYEGPPVFFGILAYWQNMEVEGSVSRDVSMKVVKQ